MSNPTKTTFKPTDSNFGPRFPSISFLPCDDTLIARNPNMFLGVFRAGSVPNAWWRDMFAAARAAFGIEDLMFVYASPDRAWFQQVGDPTPYSIALVGYERDLFTGWFDYTARGGKVC